jgi:hypothetical protein
MTDENQGSPPDDGASPGGGTSRIIEGKWKCRNCHTEGILGRHKQCPSCGNPREDGAEMSFDFGAQGGSGDFQAETVTDAKALELAEAGEDWFCEFCGTGNRGDQSVCRNCAAGRTVRATRFAQPQSQGREAPPPAKKKSGVAALVVGGLILSLGLWAFWATREKSITGKVVRAEWVHQVSRETFERKVAEGWRDELHLIAPQMPVQGVGEVGGVENLRACTPRVKKTVQEPCGTQRVCHPSSERYSCGSERKCQTQNLKNGFAKEVCSQVPKFCTRTVERCADEIRYCARPIYSTWCAYDTFAWKEAEKKVEQGEVPPTRWPELRPGSLDRIRKSSSYTAVIEYQHRGGKKEWPLKLETEAQFQEFPVGKTMPLLIKNLGGQPALAPQK